MWKPLLAEPLISPSAADRSYYGTDHHVSHAFKYPGQSCLIFAWQTASVSFLVANCQIWLATGRMAWQLAKCFFLATGNFQSIKKISFRFFKVA